ncbi:MAG: YkgJ family cysteine cluster protein [Desulfurococcaceae archaeon]|uniref:YkgJ family cysteine cluster protein n=1 Tax=Staphylothermus marinus TaxID=2280 RepID=A0A7C4D7Y1_STAMA
MNIFRCVKTCGSKCCSFKTEEESPLVYPWEKRYIESLANNQVFKQYFCYALNDTLVVLLYKWVMYGKCVFLKGNYCSIHSNKPLSCRMYPLLIGFDDNTLRVSSLCPYVSLDDAVSNPQNYFEEEYRIAMKNYILLKLIDDYMISGKWMRILNPDIRKYSVVKDIDEIIEPPEIDI